MREIKGNWNSSLKGNILSVEDVKMKWTAIQLHCSLSYTPNYQYKMYKSIIIALSFDPMAYKASAKPPWSQMSQRKECRFARPKKEVNMWKLTNLEWVLAVYVLMEFDGICRGDWEQQLQHLNTSHSNLHFTQKKNNAKLLPFDRWLEFEYMLCKVSFYENSPTPTSQLTSGENKIELLRRVHCHISLLKL